MFKRILLLALSLMAVCIASASADSLPLTDGEAVKDRFAVNPRPIKDIGDPHILKAGDEYFTFATGGTIGFNVWRSNDLVNFTKEKAV